MNGSGTMPQKKAKKSIREISPIDVYSLLPRTNCRECGESNCMAFATLVVNGELSLTACPPLHTDKYRKEHESLSALMAPPVRQVTLGTGETGIAVGGKYVLQRHEFTYHNPTPVAIDVNDLMTDEELDERVRQISGFSYNYIGRTLTLNAIAVRSCSGDPAVFGAAVKKVVGATSLPLILCALDPVVMEAGLAVTRGRIASLMVSTAAGCIMRKRSMPASIRVRALTVSQMGPRSSRGPYSGAIFIHASRAAQALVAADRTGCASSESPMSAAYRACS